MKLGSLSSLVVLTLALAGCGKSETDQPPAAVAKPTIPGSEIATAVTRELQPAFSLPAVVEAIQTAEVRPEVTATLVKNHFSAGDVVEQGALLVELNDENYRSALHAAKAEVEAAKASAMQAAANWKRAESLMPKGFISQLDYDTARANIAVAEATVSKAEAQLEKAELDIAHTKIKAPFSGRISKPGYANGDNVSPSGSPLFELVQLDPIYVSTSVELSRYNALVMLRTKMEKSGLEFPEFLVTLKLAGNVDYPHQGKFQNWSHESSESTGMITARAEFPNPDGLLLPGQNVTVNGKALQKVARVMIPQNFIRQDQQGHFVFLLDKDLVIQRRKVDVGVRDGLDWAVKDGLSDGDRVVSPGLQGLKPGLAVAVEE